MAARRARARRAPDRLSGHPRADRWRLARARRSFTTRCVRPGTRLLGPLLARSPRARRAIPRAGADQLVVLDLDSGAEKARVEVPSPIQGFLFPAPGFGRDVYYQSLTTIARVAVKALE